MTSDGLAMRIHARQSWCSHGGAVEVKLMTGERVAWLRADCGKQLPPDHWIALAEQDLLRKEPRRA